MKQILRSSKTRFSGLNDARRTTGASGKTVTERLYPEAAATGFARCEHRFVFYSIVNALLSPSATVLDFGAGRGRWNESGYLRQLTTLRGKCARVYGFDVDPIVLHNESVDEPRHAAVGAPLPFADGELDMIVSYAVFEHLVDPGVYAAELDRVLRPGGWIIAWTPNGWSYVALAARLVPNALHARVLRSVGCTDRESHDVFPTYYRLNTRGSLRRHFPGWADYSFCASGPPGYHGERMWLARLVQAANWLLPPGMQPYRYVVLQKPEG